jgi:hypothetical protein
LDTHGLRGKRVVTREGTINQYTALVVGGYYGVTLADSNEVNGDPWLILQRDDGQLTVRRVWDVRVLGEGERL